MAVSNKLNGTDYYFFYKFDYFFFCQTKMSVACLTPTGPTLGKELGGVDVYREKVKT